MTSPHGLNSFAEASPFVSWAFTRSAELCDQLTTEVPRLHGCSVVEPGHVAQQGFLTYCERSLGAGDGWGWGGYMAGNQTWHIVI